MDNLFLYHLEPDDLEIYWLNSNPANDRFYTEPRFVNSENKPVVVKYQGSGGSWFNHHYVLMNEFFSNWLQERFGVAGQFSVIHSIESSRQRRLQSICYIEFESEADLIKFRLCKPESYFNEI